MTRAEGWRIRMTNRNSAKLWHQYFIVICIAIFVSMVSGFGVKIDESYIDIGINLNSYVITNEGYIIYYLYMAARVIIILYGICLIFRYGYGVFSYIDHIVIAMFLWALISSVWSIDSFITIKSVLNIVLIQLMAIVAADRLSREGVVVVIWWATAALIAYSFVAAAVGTPSELMDFGTAWSGLMPTKNIFGGLCGIFVLITFSARIVLRKFLLLKAGVVLIGFYALIKSGSMGAIISLLFSLSVVFVARLLCKAGTGKKRSGLISLLTVSAAFISVGYFSSDLLSLFGREVTFSGRTGLWQAVLPMTTKYPLGTGYGLAGGDIALGLISQSIGNYYRAIDNAYIVLAVELGWGMVFVYACYLIGVATRVLDGRAGEEVGEHLLVGVGSFIIAHAFVEKTGGPYFGLDFFVLIMISTVATKDGFINVGSYRRPGNILRLRSSNAAS